MRRLTARGRVPRAAATSLSRATAGRRRVARPAMARRARGPSRSRTTPGRPARSTRTTGLKGKTAAAFGTVTMPRATSRHGLPQTTITRSAPFWRDSDWTLATRAASGAEGPGLGVGAGVGEGVGEGVGLGVGAGVGEGSGLGLGVGLGVGYAWAALTSRDRSST